MKETPAYYQEIPVWNDVIPFTTPEDANRKESRPKDGGIIRIHDVTEAAVRYFPTSGTGPHPHVHEHDYGGSSLLHVLPL